ncbi:protein DYAD-like [Vicia villosa]|uniref:protein DYAD-like n=1 Tax=Vicia villosa TaxID=3911 RepID=UPI00273B39F2|nr:protein DYAD-like [Vicia villosa]
MESEFVALASAGQEVEWLRDLLLEVPLAKDNVSKVLIHCDSQATLARAFSEVYNGKSRHIGLKHSLIMEESGGDFPAAQDLVVDHVHVDKGKRASEEFKVGRFYKIDHSKLPLNCPAQIKCVSIVMVCDKGEQQVSLRYPSLHSLSTHFNDQSFGKPGGKKIPTLDDKYVMGMEFAIKTLCRSISAEEFAQKRNSWSFWASPSEESFLNHNSPVINDAASSLVSKQGPCWSQLKFTGMVQWGQRRQVCFLGRHEEQKVESLHQLHKEKRERTYKKRKNVEEEMEDVKLAPFGVLRMTRQSFKNQQDMTSSSGAKKSKKAVSDTKQQQLVVYSKKGRKVSIDRWSAERYKMAEENMLKVMKEREAVYGNPIMRQDLRSEARKYIGDTGLLDHLLKHMAGKVVPGGVERFRRRHNAEGSMEYWLESADLVDIRKEMGVQDPYWTPPPGWKPGDSISPEHVTRNELREIREEIIKLKRDMLDLKSKKEEEALAIVVTSSPCLSSVNYRDYDSQVSKQEIYAELVHKKARVEEQLKEITLTLNDMEGQLGMLKPTMSESLTPPALLLGPTSSLTENIGEVTREVEEGTNDKGTKSADTQMVRGSAAEHKAAKIERLKSGFKICKPRGTFMWPNMSVSPHVVANLDELTVVPTPTSVSSSATSAPKLVSNTKTGKLPLSPSSPVKPLAERRPVSTTTLSHVTGPFSPHLSPPLETSKSTITKKDSSINLNETPLAQE